jgi:myo-inositol 2-dehydrogenase / D-chiro-inositol 1-dehydrogenase
MIRIGLLGCGRIGQIHATNIARNPSMSLARVFDVVPGAAQCLAEAHGSSVAASAEDLIRTSEIDAIVVGSSTDTHSDLMLAAARADKAIYGEKPIDLDMRRASATAKELQASGVPIMIGFQRRYDPVP